MKTTFFQNKYIQAVGLILIGIALGWVFFHPRNDTNVVTAQDLTSSKIIWTCSMHPQIRQDKPGVCPICGMELIPLDQNSHPADSSAVVLDQSAIQLANIQTSVVTKGNPLKEVRLQGEIQPDERSLQTQPAHIPGRIEKLLVNFTGEPIRQGQVIAQIYAPELISIQQELFEALKYKKTNPELAQTVEDKLRSWKLTTAQIKGIEKSNTIRELFTIKATSSGTVVKKLVNIGDYITRGQALYEVADLSRVWVMLNAYATDLPWIKKGQEVSFTTQAIPGKIFHGRVSFIDPIIDPQKRIARIRVAMSNPSGKLKPGLFVTAKIHAQPDKKPAVIVPRSAVLWTGDASFVYVKDRTSVAPAFICREVKLGALSGEWYVIKNGLTPGEEIVTNGAFAVDAAAQLAGKPSMMNPVHSSGKKNISGKQSPMKMPPISPKLRSQLGGTVPPYLILVENFVLSDPAKVSTQSNILLNAINRINTSMLNNKSNQTWIENLSRMKYCLKQMSKSKNIEHQRSTFVVFNELYFNMVRNVGIDHTTLYHQFCPMANSNKGAYWLSKDKSIRNPYLGKKMLNCGKTQETIK